MICSLQNKKIKEWLKLKQKKYRDRYNCFLVCDDEVVFKYREQAQFILTSEDIHQNNQVLVSQEVLQRFTTDQKMVGIFPKFQKPTDLGGKVLIADAISDPNNLAIIIQAMVFYQFDTLIVGNYCADIYQEKVVQSAQDNFFQINFLEIELLPIIQKMKKDGYKIFSTALQKQSIELKDAVVSDKIALVLGNEGHGVSKEVLSLSDEIIKISMSNLDSLNVSMAANIAMHHFSK